MAEAVRRMEDKLPDWGGSAHGSEDGSGTSIAYGENYEELQITAPIPPAEELERIERLHPGATDRLLRMAEGDQEIARMSVDADSKREDRHLELVARGQWFFLALIVVFVAAILVAASFSVTGAICVCVLGVACLVCCSSTLVTGRTSKAEMSASVDSESVSFAASNSPSDSDRRSESERPDRAQHRANRTT